MLPRPRGQAQSGAAIRLLFCGGKHRANRVFVECADVDVERGTNGGDFCHFLFFVRHNRRRTGGEQNIRAVVDRNIIGDVVNERVLCFDVVKDFFEHTISLKR